MSRSSCPICNMKKRREKKEKCCLELRSTSESKRIEIRGHPPSNENGASLGFFLFAFNPQIKENGKGVQLIKSLGKMMTNILETIIKLDNRLTCI